MFNKLEEVENRFERVKEQLQRPGVADDQGNYRQLMREYAELEPLVELFKGYKKILGEIQGNKELLDTEKDPELRAMAKEELTILSEQRQDHERRLKIALLPKDPNDEKNVILEIRAGAGGDEASLFAEELFRGYSIFATSRGWKVQLISTSPGNVGGFKEVIASISGDQVYSVMKYESGVHRVQRVPKTESQGRVHTSTVTVAIIPEAEAVEVNIDPKDLRIDVFRSGGHGGQSVNTTDSAVRVTHIPTGLVTTCQDGKSQLSNKEQALKVLYSRMLAIEEERSRKEASQERLAQIGTGDRSERIRTYNFPQSRLTDHRINFTTHNLSEIMSGAFDTVIEPLITHFQAEALKHQGTA